MAHKIQIKRGNKADLPTLDAGEFGLCQDTNELFIGNNGNQKIFPPTKKMQVIRSKVSQSLAGEASTVLTFNQSFRLVGSKVFYSSEQPTRLTIPSGVTLVKLSAYFIITANNAKSGNHMIRIIKNGETDYGVDAGTTSYIPIDGILMTFRTRTLSIKVVEGDYFEVSFSNGSDTAMPTSSWTAYFMIEVIE